MPGQSKYKPAPKRVGPVMNFAKLYNKLKDETSTINFAQERGLLPNSITCNCGSEISKYSVDRRKNGTCVNFRCNLRNIVNYGYLSEKIQYLIGRILLCSPFGYIEWYI